MRWILSLAILAGVALAQGRTYKQRVVKGPEERVTITVPAVWTDIEIAGNRIIWLDAKGYGGHNLRVERESGQDDVDKQRDRYLEFDSGNYPGSTVQKFTKPYFGYRLNSPAGKRVMCRSFITDGADGLIVTVVSRFRNYDKVYAKKIEEIITSLKIEGGGAGNTSTAGEMRRIYDKQTRVSIVLPALWKRLTPVTEKDLLFIALKGVKTGPRFLVHDWGPRLNPGLTLLKVSSQWNKAYGSIHITRAGKDPPGIVVQNRVPGSVDYLLAFENAGRGYTLMLTVREGSFEKFRPLADQTAKSIVFSGGKWSAPKVSEAEIKEEYKKFGIVHASVEQTSTVDAVIKCFAGFEKHWSRIGVGYSRKSPPLEVVISTDEDFATTSHYFGRAPATYDRVAHAIVVAPAPKGDKEFAMWRGRVYWAMAENALHRDVAVTVPVWVRAGLAACMEAAGRTGKSPKEPHPSFVARLVLKTSTDAHKPLSRILAMKESDVYFAESPDTKVQAWGYMHMMLYGRSALGSLYKRYARALGKGRGVAPRFKPKYDKGEADLKKHAFKNWEQK